MSRYYYSWINFFFSVSLFIFSPFPSFTATHNNYICSHSFMSSLLGLNTLCLSYIPLIIYVTFSSLILNSTPPSSNSNENVFLTSLLAFLPYFNCLLYIYILVLSLHPHFNSITIILSSSLPSYNSLNTFFPSISVSLYLPVFSHAKCTSLPSSSFLHNHWRFLCHRIPSSLCYEHSTFLLYFHSPLPPSTPQVTIFTIISSPLCLNSSTPFLYFPFIEVTILTSAPSSTLLYRHYPSLHDHLFYILLLHSIFPYFSPIYFFFYDLPSTIYPSTRHSYYHFHLF